MEAEEADVDVEGDVAAAAQSGNDESTSVVPDHYLDSSWKIENGFVPWTLDNTISEENRAVIEKMLLEEEYYLSNKSFPGKFWVTKKEDDKKCMNSLQKTAKIMVHSPTKPASYSVKWTIEEKELFEQGLAKFGRRWTKIAALVESRTVLQVKSYARQYFKNKVKQGVEKEIHKKSSSDLQVKTKDEGVKAWTMSCLRGRADPNLNAVKIEKLSDDEEVDITDELDELTSQTPQNNSRSLLPLDIPNSQVHKTNQGEAICLDCPIATSYGEDLQNIKQGETQALSSSKITLKTERQSNNYKNSLELNDKKYDNFIENSDGVGGNAVTDNARQWPSPEPCETPDLSGNEMLLHSSCQFEENHEEEELKPPEQEVEIDRNTIQEEEKQAIPEFFEGRQAKTPERYLKIRNYILDQ